jgi:hypothetical protein
MHIIHYIKAKELKIRKKETIGMKKKQKIKKEKKYEKIIFKEN